METVSKTDKHSPDCIYDGENFAVPRINVNGFFLPMFIERRINDIQSKEELDSIISDRETTGKLLAKAYNSHYELLEALKEAKSALIDLYSNEYIRKYGVNEKRCIEFLREQPILRLIESKIKKAEQ